MKPLVVLLVSFLAGIGVSWLTSHMPLYSVSGRIAMSVMLLFTALGHFKFSEGMAMMIPPYMPGKKAWVWITGMLEVLGAIGLLITATAFWTGIALMVFFVLVTPANIYAAYRQVNYQEGNFEGKGLAYLWFRIPLQALFILWVYWFAVR